MRDSVQTLSDLLPGNYNSPYLCSTCHHALYTQLSKQREVCLNSGCAEWPADYSSIVDAHAESAPSVYTELEEQRGRILESLRHCNLASLRRFLHEVRKKLAQSLLSTGGMRISEWHAVSELLIFTQAEPSRRLHTAGHEDPSVFTAILRETSAWAGRMRLMEDLRTGRYRMLRRRNGEIDGEAFALKYLAAVRSSDRALGLAESLDQLDEAFEYEHIETAATPSQPADSTDLADLLETLWPFTLHFRHALRSHWRTSQ